jgi:hypothetical protein
MDETEYLKSQFRCPICGALIGCKNITDNVECSIEEFHNHVKQCRDESRVKPGRIRYENED